MIYAVAEFGSSSRNTSDCYSDRDLLVVCPMSRRRTLHARYTARGYNVTLLSESQLLRLKVRGSLFLQHLKSEATIRIDVQSRLQLFLDQCNLVCPSAAELEKCEDSLTFLASWPDIVSLRAWKADYLFCASRDYLIKRLAAKGSLAFGLEDIERKAVDLFGVKRTEFGEFYSLRKAKVAYRSRAEFPNDLASVAARWNDVLRSRFGLRLPMGWPIDVGFDVTLLVKRSFNSPYERLSLEAVYLLARANGILHADHARLMKHIEQPNFYRASQKSKEQVVHAYCRMSDVVAMVGNRDRELLK